MTVTFAAIAVILLVLRVEKLEQRMSDLESRQRAESAALAARGD